MKKGNEEDKIKNKETLSRLFSYGTSGLKAIPSEIGKLIGHDLSPAIFNDQKMRNADLAYYVGDKRTILMVAPQLIKIIGQLPSGKILFFHCKEGELTEKEICDFFNKVCTQVPFKLNPEDMTKLGSIPYQSGANFDSDVKHTYWGVALDKWEPSKSKTTNDISDKIPEEFEKLKADDKELQEADVSVKIVKKEDLEKYCRRDKTGISKLDDSSKYIAIFAKKDKMNESKIAEMINALSYAANSNSSIDASDVIPVVTIRKSVPGSDTLESYSIFAVKI